MELVSIKQNPGINMVKKNTFVRRLVTDFKSNWQLYIMVMPLLLFYLLFHYKPMYGVIIAFKDYSTRLGIVGSEWVGLKHFTDFFTGPYFMRTLWNTFFISFCTLLFSFPMPVILALLINELRSKKYSRLVQTVSYLPHFISLVVICSLIKDFTSQKGVITAMLEVFGFPKISMLNEPKLFVPVYVVSDIWQSMGWGSIVYLAALTSISQELYEAARIDGASRLKQIVHISLPCIMPTVTVMLILRIGGLMNLGYEKIILLQNPAIYSTSDVISTFVYRRGIIDRSYSFSAAVGLFNSIINCLLLIISNMLSKRLNETSLW